MFFLDDGLAVPLGPLWFLPPLKKFLAQMTLTLSSIVILTVGSLEYLWFATLPTSTYGNRNA
jgi:uncharacterized RDD family membrane protein YckC